MLRLVICFLFLSACGLGDYELPDFTQAQSVGLHNADNGLHLSMSPISDAGTDSTITVRVALENCDGQAITDVRLQTEVVLGIKTEAGYRELGRGQTDKGIAVFHFKLDDPSYASFLHAEAIVGGQRLETEGGPFSVDPLIAGDFFIYPRHIGNVGVGELFPVYIMSKKVKNNVQGRHRLRVLNHNGEVLSGALGMWNMRDIYDLSAATALVQDKQELPQSLREHVVARFDVFFTADSIGMGVSRIVGYTADGAAAIGAEAIPHTNNTIRMSADYDALKLTTLVNFSANPYPMPSDPLRIRDQASIVFTSTAAGSGKVQHVSYGNVPFSGKNGYGFWLQPADFPCSVGGNVWVKVGSQVYQARCTD